MYHFSVQTPAAPMEKYGQSIGADITSCNLNMLLFAISSILANTCTRAQACTCTHTCTHTQPIYALHFLLRVVPEDLL